MHALEIFGCNVQADMQHREACTEMVRMQSKQADAFCCQNGLEDPGR